MQFSLNQCKKLMSERSLPTNLEICRCAGLGDVTGLTVLLRQGTSPGSQDEHGNTPLFHAIWRYSSGFVLRIAVTLTCCCSQRHP